VEQHDDLADDAVAGLHGKARRTLPPPSRLISRYAVVMSSVIASAPFVLPAAPTAPDLVAKYFKVLSDPTRVRVLELLRDGRELSVSQLMAALGQAQSKVSNHLACLRWCGFVQTRREHRVVFYRVADGRVLELVALAQALLADNAEHVAACQRVGTER
ncbi:MAG: ArsR/SmtB family transcription factor, partial [Solirubrobacteraceae bacterium]